VNVVSAVLVDGAMFTTDTSWTMPDSDEYWGESELDVVGTDGSLEVDDYGEAFRVVRDGAGGGATKHHFGESENEALLRDFVAAVETDRDPVATRIDVSDR